MLIKLGLPPNNQEVVSVKGPYYKVFSPETCEVKVSADKLLINKIIISNKYLHVCAVTTIEKNKTGNITVQLKIKHMCVMYISRISFCLFLSLFSFITSVFSFKNIL